MCLYPRLIRNPKYQKNKKNKGNIPLVSDPRVLYVPIGCTNCMECRKQKARQWQVRLQEDIRHNKNAKFITLTFSNESILKIARTIETLKGYELDNEIATKAVRWFLERWRKKYKKSLRHWLITELGHKGTENLHLHGIIWTDIIDKDGKKWDTINDLRKIWTYGFVWDGQIINGKKHNYVSDATINYLSKYVTKVDLIHKTYKPKILTSAGIGANYTKTVESEANKFNRLETNETYRTRSGHKLNLPIYWRNKIWTDEEKEILWLQKLDKQERWINGIKIDISKTEELYHKILATEREKNKKLGYGNNNKNWNRIQYEEERREIILQTRINNAIEKQKKQTPSARSNQKGTD